MTARGHKPSSYPERAMSRLPKIAEIALSNAQFGSSSKKKKTGRESKRWVRRQPDFRSGSKPAVQERETHFRFAPSKPTSKQALDFVGMGQRTFGQALLYISELTATQIAPAG